MGPSGEGVPEWWLNGWSFPYHQMLDVAADIGLSESQFWQMTPAEFTRRVNYVTKVRNHRAEVMRQKEDNALWRAAWICSTIMNMAGKRLPDGRRINPEELIRKKDTAEGLREMRRVLVKRHRLDERFGIYE